MAKKIPEVSKVKYEDYNGHLVCHGGLKLLTFIGEDFKMVPLSRDSGIYINNISQEDNKKKTAPPRATFGLSLYDGFIGEGDIVPNGFPEQSIFIADNGEAIRLNHVDTASDVYKSLFFMPDEIKAEILGMIGELDRKSDLFTAAWDKKCSIEFYPVGSKNQLPPNAVVGVEIIPLRENHTHPAYSLAITSNTEGIKEGIRIYDGKTVKKIYESLSRLPMDAKERLLGFMDDYGLEPLPEHI